TSTRSTRPRPHASWRARCRDSLRPRSRDWGSGADARAYLGRDGVVGHARRRARGRDRRLGAARAASPERARRAARGRRGALARRPARAEHVDGAAAADDEGARGRVARRARTRRGRRYDMNTALVIVTAVECVLLITVLALYLISIAATL